MVDPELHEVLEGAAGWPQVHPCTRGQPAAPGSSLCGGTISHFGVLAGLPMCELGPTNNIPTLCVSLSVDRSPHQG